MAYGKIKVDTLVYDNSGSDVELTVSAITAGGSLSNYALLAGATFTGDVNFDGEIVAKGDSTNGSGQLTLNCENNSHGVKIKGPPHSAAANYTLTLPDNTGTNNQFLTTNGSGALSWTSPTVGVSLSGLNTWTAGQRGEISTISVINSGGSRYGYIYLNNANNFQRTMTGNLIMTTSNRVEGQAGSIFLTQDSSGNRTASWGSEWEFAGGIAPTLSTTPGAIDRIDYIVRSSSKVQAVATLNYS